jgi:hypothetical protein
MLTGAYEETAEACDQLIDCGHLCIHHYQIHADINAAMQISVYTVQ